MKHLLTQSKPPTFTQTLKTELHSHLRWFAGFNIVTLLLALGLGGASTARAASDSWNVDAAGNWVDAVNWLGGQVPGDLAIDNTDVATFNKSLTAVRNISPDANRHIGGISFENTSANPYQLFFGGPLLLNNGGMIQALPNNGPHQDIVFTPIIITGSGTASATFLAGATLGTSSLQFRQVTGSATPATTTTLNLDGANAANINFLNGTVANGAGGPLSIVKSGAGNWEFQNNHTFTGPITINAGSLNVGGGTGNLGGGNYPGNITNNGVFLYKSSRPQTLAGDISGSGRLEVTGSGPRVTLSGTNTYTGGTTNSSTGLLVFRSTDAKPASGLVVATNATFGVGGIGLGVAASGPYFTSANVDSMWANTMPGVSIAPGSRVGVDTTAGDFTYTLPSLPSHSFEKLGANTLNLAGVNTSTNNIFAHGGILNISGTVSNVPSSTIIGDLFGEKAMLQVPTGGKLTTLNLTAGQFTAGDGTTLGSLLVNGGDVVTTTTGSDGLRVGWGVYGGFFMSSGSIKTRWYDGGVGNVLATSVNVGQITGGNFTNNGFLILRGAYNEFTLVDGNVDRTLADNSISVGETGVAAVFTVAGGFWDNTGANANGTVQFGRVGATTTAKGSVNLNGGTLLIRPFLASALNTAGSFVNFNGGILKPSLDSTTFLPAGITAVYVNGAFGTYAGGAVVDSNGKNITFVKPLLAPTGNGVSGLTLNNAGSGYIGAPYVDITGGGGSGATAFVQVDLNPASGTFGRITNVVLSNPGVGYTSTPTVTLRGGGGTGGAVIASGIGANTSGGLTKTGAGTLTLSGANTYTGNTTVNNGTLALDVSGSIANSPVIKVAGGATLDVSAASFTLGAAHTLAGNGTVTGAATLNGTVSPGASIGELTFGTAPTLGGTLLMEIATPNSADKISVISGTVNFGGTLTVANIGGSLANGTTFDLFDGTLAGNFATVNLPGGPGHWNTSDLNFGGTITFNNANPVAQNLTMGCALGETVSLLVIGSPKHAPTDADGDSMTVTAVGAASSGTSGFTSTSVTYVADGTLGTHTFTYTVTDALGATDTRTVTVQVSSPEGFNRLSPPSIIGPGTVSLSYLGIPGFDYALDWATNLTQPINWTAVITNTAGNTPGTYGQLNFTNTSSEPLNFFRTRQVP